jgi:hypothetical protein
MRTTSADDPTPEAGDEPGGTPPASVSPPPPSHSALVFGDPLDQRSDDETGRGWGDRPAANSGSQADLARFLDEKPPHHI